MITYGEVFAGIGAARAAFGSLGWYDQYVIEKSNPALAQYLYNWDREFRDVVDSQSLNHKQILDLTRIWSNNKLYRNLYNVNREVMLQGRDNFAVDVCMTSPPCQSFSVAGKRGGLKNKGDLFFETHRFLELTQPKCFILENVPGMMNIEEDINYDNLARSTSKSDIWKYRAEIFPKYVPRRTFYDIILPSLGKTANSIKFPKKKSFRVWVWREEHNQIVSMKPLPYRLFFRKIDATSFGSPMSRTRVIIVGFREDLNIKRFDWRIPVTVKTKNVLDFIEPNRPYSDDFRFRPFYQGEPYHTNALYSRKVIDSQGLHLRSDKAEPYVSTLVTRIDPARSTVVRNDQGDYRSFADEQMRRLMGFPDGFVSNVVSESASIVNYGNSIYVPMLKHIGQRIQDTLKIK